MGNSSSKALGIVIVLIIVAGGIWFMTRKPADDTTAMMPAQQAAPVQNAAPAAPVNPPVAQIQSGGSSDAALTQDSASIDAQLQGLDSDNTTAAQSVQ